MNFCIHSANFRKYKMMMIILPAILLFFANGGNVSAATDTTWSVTFQVNMSKAVKNNKFNPATDYVYVGLDHGLSTMKLVEGPGYVYSGTLYNALDSGLVYHYKYRINDGNWEAVTRSFTPRPGMVTLSDWWNNEPINYTTFIVNMQYAVQYLLFNPAVDSVCVSGTMNNMQGSPKMNRLGTSFNYYYIYSLEPGTIQEFKYRINQGDSSKGQCELLYQPNRMIRVPDTLASVSSDFNNYNPAKRPMTFNCNMAYYIKTHRFSVTGDYVDVAGNFNLGGANDVLFKQDTDSIYTIRKFIDTTYFHMGPVTFKFRINSKWSSAERQGKPYRTYALHDTVNQNPNHYSCYFNDMDPAVATPPWAYNLGIQGHLVHNDIVNGYYSYEDVNGIREDSTTYRWLRSADSLGTSAVAIDSMWKITYTVDTLDIGKWLVFEVTPRAARGDSATGKPVRVVSVTKVGGVGIEENSGLITKVYPNPVTNNLTVEAKKELIHIQVIDFAGKTVLDAGGLHTRAIRLQMTQLPRGIYLMKATAGSGETGVAEIIKN